ncbi:hypothetical protein V8F20_003677 [Naviculisporaceae sp. PSN 640]
MLLVSWTATILSCSSNTQNAKGSQNRDQTPSLERQPARRHPPRTLLECVKNKEGQAKAKIFRGFVGALWTIICLVTFSQLTMQTAIRTCNYTHTRTVRILVITWPAWFWCAPETEGRLPSGVAFKDESNIMLRPTIVLTITFKRVFAVGSRPDLLAVSSKSSSIPSPLAFETPRPRILRSSNPYFNYAGYTLLNIYVYFFKGKGKAKKNKKNKDKKLEK